MHKAKIVPNFLNTEKTDRLKLQIYKFDISYGKYHLNSNLFMKNSFKVKFECYQIGSDG